MRKKPKPPPTRKREIRVSRKWRRKSPVTRCNPALRIRVRLQRVLEDVGVVPDFGDDGGGVVGHEIGGGGQMG